MYVVYQNEIWKLIQDLGRAFESVKKSDPHLLVVIERDNYQKKVAISFLEDHAVWRNLNVLKC